MAALVDLSGDDAAVAAVQLATDEDRIAGTQRLAIPSGDVLGDLDLTHKPPSCLPRVGSGENDQQQRDRISIGVRLFYGLGNEDSAGFEGAFDGHAWPHQVDAGPILSVAAAATVRVASNLIGVPSSFQVEDFATVPPIWIARVPVSVFSVMSPGISGPE